MSEIMDAEFEADAASLVPVRRQTAVDIRAEIECMTARAEMLNNVRRLALSQLAGNPQLLTAYGSANGNRFRLTRGGAARVARLCGVTVDAPVWDRENTGEYTETTTDRDGREKQTARYHASCEVSVGFPAGGVVTQLGSADSGQGLFKGKPLSPVVKENIRKHAHGNGLVRAVEILLGLSDLTDEDLRAAGCDPEKVTVVSFNEGGDAARQSSSTASAATSGKSDDEIRVHVRDLLAALDVEDISQVNSLVVELSAFTNSEGKDVAGRPLSDLKGKWLANTVKRVQTLCDTAARNGECGYDSLAALVPAVRKALDGGAR